MLLLFLFHESIFGGKGLVAADGILAYPPWNNLSPPGNYILGDQYFVFIPTHDFMHRELMEGRLPLWNPYLACGMPCAASIQFAAWFPIQLLSAGWDSFTASGPAAFAKLFLAGLFTMLYLRQLGVSSSGAFFSGLIFSLSGFMIAWLGHPHVNCAMWLPLLLYLIERTFQPGQPPGARASLWTWTVFALAYGMMILGGHPPTTIQISLLIFSYVLFRLFDRALSGKLARLGIFFAFCCAGILVAAIQVIPYLEYYLHSSSGSSSVSLQRWSLHLSPGMLVHFLLPYVTGSPADGYEDLSWLIGPADTTNFNERTGYVGILPLLFAAYGVVCRRDRLRMFFASVIFISLLLVIGVPPFAAIIKHVPVLRDVSSIRLLLLIGFGVAVLAGQGWDVFNQLENRKRIIRVTLAFLLIAGGAFALLGWHAYTKWAGLDAAHRIYLGHQFLIPFGSLLVIGAIFLRSCATVKWIPLVLVLGWTTVDLLSFARGYNPAISRDRYYPSAPLIESLHQDRSLFRVLGQDNSLIVDTAPMYGLYDARGIDFASVRTYEELITGSTGDFWFYRIAAQLPEAFRLLNVKYVLNGAPMKPASSDFELVSTNGAHLYRYKKYLPRALPVFNCAVKSPAEILAQVRSATFEPTQQLLLEESPQASVASLATNNARASGSVEIIAYRSDEVQIEATLSQPGFVLLLDTYFPGWTATVNTQPAKIYRADHTFRAVSVPAGKSVVTFRYHPLSFYFGAALTFTALAGLGVICLWSLRPQPPGASALANK